MASLSLPPAYPFTPVRSKRGERAWTHSDADNRKFIGQVRNARTRVAWVRQALAAGANPNATEKEETVLMTAARLNDLDKVKALLDAGADPNLPGGGPRPTALYAWTDRGQRAGRAWPAHDDNKARAIVQLLLAHGCDVKACGDYPYPPMFSIDRLDVAIMLMDAGVDPNFKGGPGSGYPGAFALMAKFGSAALRAMQARGLPLDIVEPGGGRTLFHQFATFTNLGGLSLHGYNRELDAMVDILWRAGVDINARDRDGLTPLMRTVRMHLGLKQEQPAVQALLAHGADLAAHDWHGNTALHHATEARVAQYLLAAGCDTEVRNLAGDLPDEAMVRRASTKGPVVLARAQAAAECIRTWRVARKHAEAIAPMDGGVGCGRMRRRG